MDRIIHLRRLAASLAILAALLLVSACSAPETAVDQAGALTEVYLNPYRNECTVNGDLRLCYVANVSGTDNFSTYAGEIENFAYEWGYSYGLKGNGDENSFRVEEVVTKAAEPGGVHFPLTLTGGAERIVKVAEGLYEFYGEKRFTCGTVDSCSTLDRVLTREEPIAFQFQTPDNPADPLILLDWTSSAVAAQVGEQPGLMRNQWVLQSFTVDKNVQELALAGSRVTANFALDESLSTGTVSGNGGCNNYTANITISGNAMTIKDLARGEVQCSDPPGVMDQEQRFLSALTVAESYSVDSGRLEILYNSGNSILHFISDGE
ncbi:MAG: META domain-containing protein [Ardenticatenaceae bacterium]|nr:META domain-containing protein [Ardenticatenaceae bacterium]MCB8988721.1 META domain-containing protein [Ardenticatenaceae bacterium]